MYSDLRTYFLKYKKRVSIILCDTNGVITNKNYEFLFSESMNRLKNFVETKITQTECFGILLKNEHNIYLPFLFAILNSLGHAFVILNSENVLSKTKNLKTNWIISFSDIEMNGFTMEHKINVNDDNIFIWKNQVFYSTGSFYKTIFCVVETSGSTGDSKIIRVPFECIVQNADNLRTLFKINENDFIYWGTPLTFDPSLIELLISVLSGACLVITPEKVKLNVNKLFTTLFQPQSHYFKGVTVIQTVPSVFLRYSNKQIQTILSNSCLKVLAFGGEEFPNCILKYNKSPNLKMFNIYGISELSCWATFYQVENCKYGADIPLGRPLNGILTQVRDNDGKIVENGEGELFIGSSSRFCLVNSEEWDNTTNRNIFRSTGDIVKLDENEMYYVGRKNNIIKRFGNKVNLTLMEQIIYKETDLINKCVWFQNKLILFIVLNEISETNINKILDKLQVKLLKILPHYYLPDFKQIVPKLPLNLHGKICKSTLEQYFVFFDNTIMETLTCHEVFIRICSKYLGLNFQKNNQLSERSFFELGGNSIVAIQLLNEIRGYYNVPDNFVTLFFDSCVKSCVDFLQHNPLTKNKYKDITAVRAGENKNISIDNYLKILWKYDLKACVDCSPLVHEHNNRKLITVGSFSNILASVDENGVEYFTILLPDVIEASPTASHCGQYIFIGSFDGCMYCIDLNVRKIAWKYSTEDRIKSTVCLINKFTALVFGSYDKCVHCVTTQSGTLLWKTRLNGSISSSPIYNDIKRLIYIGTTVGTCWCLSDDGQILWTYNSNSPIFGSPTFLNPNKNLIIWPNVTGKIFCVCCDSGLFKWEFQCDGHIFSSLKIKDNKCIFGCLDKCVYILDVSCEECKLVHKFRLDGGVSSTPFIVDGKTIATATNSGVLYILDLETKSIKKIHDLREQVFSSPFVCDNRIYVGCRDNNLYCLEM